MTHSLGASEVTAAIHEHVKQMIAHDTMAIYVSREDQLEPIEIVGENSHLFSRDAFPIEKGLSGRVIQHKTSILNGDPCMEFGFNNDSVVVYKLQSALAVLMKGPKGMLGVITLYQKDLRAFNRDHLRLLEAVSLQVAPAIESALRYHDTEKMAVTDHLTGLPNARSLELHLHRELSRAQREEKTVGVLVCDLNGFKGVNDRFGHLKGNEVLQVVAKGLAGCLPEVRLRRAHGRRRVRHRLTGFAGRPERLLCGTAADRGARGRLERLQRAMPLHGRRHRHLSFRRDRR